VTGPTTDRRRVRLVFGGLVLTILLASLDQTIVSSALPTIVGELGGVELMSWVVTAYLLAATIVMPAYGRLGDLIGRKGLFLTAISTFLLGSVICGLAGSVEWLIVGRAGHHLVGDRGDVSRPAELLGRPHLPVDLPDHRRARRRRRGRCPAVRPG
jgi:MFS family permease